MDGTKDPKDTSGATQDTSEGTRGTSEQPVTFTKEERDKAVSDALATAGRTAKALEEREQAVKVAVERIAQAQKEKDEAEEREAHDDPDKLTAIRARHELTRAKAELAKMTLELDAERTKGKQRDAETAETNREVVVWGISQKHTVDAETLKNLSKFTDGSTEAIEAIAQSLPKKGGQKPPLKIDSGKTIGGTGELTAEMVEKMSPEERWQRREEIAKIPLGYKSLAK